MIVSWFWLRLVRRVAKLLSECVNIQSVQLSFLGHKAVFVQPPKIANSKTVSNSKTTDDNQHLSLDYQLPRNPDISVSIPGQIKISVAGNTQRYRVIPILAPASGKLVHPDVSSFDRKQHWFFDFIVSGELLASIETDDHNTVSVACPRAGYLLSFQVLPGVEVVKGDILFLLAYQK